MRSLQDLDRRLWRRQLSWRGARASFRYGGRMFDPWILLLSIVELVVVQCSTYCLVSIAFKCYGDPQMNPFATGSRSTHGAAREIRMETTSSCQKVQTRKKALVARKNRCNEINRIVLGRRGGGRKVHQPKKTKYGVLVNALLAPCP